MIRDTVAHITAAINEKARAAGRDPSTVRIICVTKGRSPAQIREALDAGLTDIGENRVQEAGEKYRLLQRPGTRWHLIGHLQRNKVKHAVQIFDYIHSVDSIPLAEQIQKEAARIRKTIEVLIQVNVSGEATKFGLAPEEILNALPSLGAFPQVRVRGLMTIAPLTKDPETARPVFRRLRELSELIGSRRYPGIEMRYLSMGMSQDHLVAVEEGAHFVRIGTAIFEGGRPYDNGPVT